MTKSKNKPTCFFCRYEITKHNKSSKYVLYNNKMKSICRYCTKNKHKALDNKYMNTDTQCKLCNKPTLYSFIKNALNVHYVIIFTMENV